MISRETARLIAELVASAFARFVSSGPHPYTCSDSSRVYDFLFDNNFPAWLCNAARKSCSTSSTRPLQEFLMKLHTGESQYAATQDWTWPQREKLGQEYLRQLAEAILVHWSQRDLTYAGSAVPERISRCKSRLELDGFTIKGSKIVIPEEDVLDAQEEAGVLEQLYRELGLGDPETVLHHLRLSEEHYVAGRWDDSISNSRKFLECVLREVASSHSMVVRGEPLADSTATRPVRVRDYLESAGLVEAKEKETLSSIYGLLSETGGHPYMAQNDQARLLRHLALTLSQFAMLRLRGSTKKAA
jgi:hypothetical protein